MCGPHGKTQLAILWTQADREAADILVLKYAKDAKANGWWKHVSLILWGPSIKLLANDVDLQQKTAELVKLGVDVKASLEAADVYGAAGKLRELGVDVKDLGLGLTEILQDEYEDWAVLTM